MNHEAMLSNPVIEVLDKAIDKWVFGSDEQRNKTPITPNAREIASAMKRNASDVKEAIAHFEPIRDEAKAASKLREKKTPLSDHSQQLVDGYAWLKKFQLDRLIVMYDKILEGLTSATTRTRRVKKKSPLDQVKRMKYKKADEELGMEGHLPSKVIGAHLVWAFNTKTRKLAKFTADGDGFEVQGTSLKNVKKAECKNIRKPEEIFPEFRSCNDRRREILYDDIRSKPLNQTNMFNEHMMILGVA